VFWDNLDEDGSEDLPVRFGAAAVRRCDASGQVAALVGAEVVVVAIGEASSADETISATWIRASGLLALMACPCPSDGRQGRGLFLSSVCPEAITAAV
jgi:hypothetical protein